MEQPFGYISSPDLDKDGFYDFNLDWVWKVQVAYNFVIGFQVFYIDIQLHAGDCTTADYLKVHSVL